MENVIPLDQGRRHARASSISGTTAKSSAVTRLSVALRKARAKSFDNQTLPRRSREMVVRSHEAPASRISEAISSSSSPLDCMNSESRMAPNVHTAHIDVKSDCASGAVEAAKAAVHIAHMAKTAGKSRPSERPNAKQWGPTYLRAWRQKAKLSLEKAAAEMGYRDHTMLSKIERGQQPYQQEILEAAAKLYGTTVWALLYCPPDIPPEQMFEAFQRSIRPR
jgi:hypothetical protein